MTSLSSRMAGLGGPVAGVACCALAMTVLGASVPISAALAAYPTAVAQGARYGLASLVLLEIVIAGQGSSAPVRGRDWAALAALAAVGLAGFNVSLMTALRHADPAIVAAIVGCVPLVLAAISPLLSGRMPSLRTLAAAGLVVAGTGLVHGSGAASASGVAAAVLALICDVVFTLLAATLTPRLGALRVAAYSCAMAVPMLAAFSAVTGELAALRQPTAAETGVVLFLGVVLTAGMFLAWFYGVSVVGADTAGLFVALVPVTALACATLADGVAPPPGAVLGVVAVAAGLLAGLLRSPVVPTPHPAAALPGVTVLPRPALAPATAA